MSLSTTPAPARTDAPAAVPQTVPAHSSAGVRSVRRAGLAVAGGTAAWAAGILVFGLNPVDGWQRLTYDLS